MTIIRIDKKDWAPGLEKLNSSYRLFGPVKEQDFHNFKELAKGEQPDFNCLNTRLSPKSIVQPQSEIMLEFTLDESQADHHIMKEPAVNDKPRAVLGIRPCDAKAFQLVKLNFDTLEHKDVYWLRNYEASTFVGLACDNPCSACFCSTAGSGPYHEEGLDVLLVNAEDHYLAKTLTPKGEALLKSAGWQATIEPGAAEAQIAAQQKSAEERIQSRVYTDNLRGQVTNELYEAPFWEEVAFACINCGTCTYLCPTCWCFDIQDEVHGCAGVRMRNWDSCMYPLFTLHGAGHNPRGTKTHRVRQRFMHKLKYYVDKYDNGIQCVGCGRCIRFCPVNIDIRDVIDKMNTYGTCQVDQS